MKTLFERLSTENQTKVLENKRVDFIKGILDNETFFNSVTLFQTLEIYWLFYPYKPFDLIEYYELFKI